MERNGEMTSIGKRTRLTGKALTRRGKKLQILRARGLFFFLPVRFSNDIVHGSWWYVAGSLLSIPMAIVPLVDVYHPFFEVPPETALPAFGQAATWILLLLMSVLYTTGSFILVRAFDEPVPEAYLKDWHHFCTDELLGAWIFVLAAIPAIPFSLVFLIELPHYVIHWFMFFGSLLLVAISAWFVYVCYPSRHHLMHLPPHVLPIVESIFGKGHWMCRHVDSDWLASTWFFLLGSLVFMFGSFVLLFESKNDRQLFLWISSYVDFLFFAVGSAYLVAGSYARPDEDTHVDYDKDAENTNGLDSLFNPEYHADFSSAIRDNNRYDDFTTSHKKNGNNNNNSTGGNMNMNKKNVEMMPLEQLQQQQTPSKFGSLVKTMNKHLGTNIEPDVPKEDVISDLIDRYSKVKYNHDVKNIESSSNSYNDRYASPSKMNTTSSSSNINNNNNNNNTNNKKKKHKDKNKKHQQQQQVLQQTFDEDEIMQL